MKSLQEKLGVKVIDKPLDSTQCKKRAAAIRSLVEKKRLPDEARKNLLKQAAWYQWKSKQFGTKSKRKAAK